MIDYIKTKQDDRSVNTQNYDIDRTQLASIPRRAVAQIVDFLLLAAIFLLVTYQAKGVWLMSPGDHLWIIFDPICGVFLLAIFCYFISMEGLFGFTLGKLATGIRVVDIQGAKITMKQSLKRNLSRLIDGVGIYFVGLWIARKSSLHQRYGDKVGHTVVIQNHRSEVPPTKSKSVTVHSDLPKVNHYKASERFLLFILLSHK